MNPRAHGQLRQSQAITTYGPGALIDLPGHSAIIGGLNTWLGDKDEINEPRLSQKLAELTGGHPPHLFAPPVDAEGGRVPFSPRKGIQAWQFPEWFVVQESAGGTESPRRRLVHRRSLEKGRFGKRAVVPIRFVRACLKGHIDDINWVWFAHAGKDPDCRRPLWLEERGTIGDLAKTFVTCECGASRPLIEAREHRAVPLGYCRGARPWIGNTAREECDQVYRLLVRNASNAYFPQVVSALSLPRHPSEVEAKVQELWGDLRIVESTADLAVVKRKPLIETELRRFDEARVVQAIRNVRAGGFDEGGHLKEAELRAMLRAKEGYGDDEPIDPNFHARRLPEEVWRFSDLTRGVGSVIQLHRLREVQALIGFTRFEAALRDIHGEYDPGVERAALAIEPTWFPATENRGEGIFLSLRKEAVRKWASRQPVKERVKKLKSGHDQWKGKTGKEKANFPGGAYILLHTLSHLLIQSLAMRCGYPASSIRERIYVEDEGFGLLLYTGSPDAEGTLGGLVQQARNIEAHLAEALRMGELCSNDPVCAEHRPDNEMEERYLHGAACHGCALISETSCEMHNDHLDRALVVPVLGVEGAAFFAPARR